MFERTGESHEGEQRGSQPAIHRDPRLWTSLPAATLAESPRGSHPHFRARSLAETRRAALPPRPPVPAMPQLHELNSRKDPMALKRPKGPAGTLIVLEHS